MSKFDSPKHELLHRLTLDGTAETYGDVNEFGRHYAGLGLVTRNELAEHSSDLLDELGLAADAFPAAAYFVVEEDSQGFVDVKEFATEGDYRAALNAAERAVAAFEEDGA